eukprot:gnl/TRDRNA2_/TRDRNA2_156981_c0_seq3.p1 gnl/TRDRNA2_/TRDRNA2_156981_c0~~gnl/TRDRNA2_/TRDRNA2_156981_c0_seq3.p1  ORF type:complete len:117 (-),score=7.76 gnl/TRDRNA2_/TRDRNA2_156981_c0_seq3:31-381(-)
MNEFWIMGGDTEVTEPIQSPESRSCRVQLRPQLSARSHVLLQAICTVNPSKIPEEQLELEFPDAMPVHLVFSDLRQIRSRRAGCHGDSRKARRIRGEQGSTTPDGFECAELGTASL